jgi:zinc/manganese transport system substrate-binding protein
MKMRLILIIALLLGTACGSAGNGETRPRVVVTTSILADVTGQIAGDQAEVVTLIPAGTEAHDFQPSAQQVARIQEADLVIANGLGLEEGLHDVLDNLPPDRLLELADEVDPIPFSGDPPDDHAHLDPHFWHDPLRMAAAVDLIAAALKTLPEVNGTVITDRAAEYINRIEAADAEIVSSLEPVSPDRRKLVTSHDSFGYFADRYGFEVIGAIIPGGSTLGAPSSADLARLVAVIRQSQVPAIFVEYGVSPALAQALAGEVGSAVQVVELYSDTLGPPGSGSATYLELITTNGKLIAEALK